MWSRMMLERNREEVEGEREGVGWKHWQGMAEKRCYSRCRHIGQAPLRSGSFSQPSTQCLWKVCVHTPATIPKTESAVHPQLMIVTRSPRLRGWVHATHPQDSSRQDTCNRHSDMLLRIRSGRYRIRRLRHLVSSARWRRRYI